MISPDHSKDPAEIMPLTGTEIRDSDAFGGAFQIWMSSERVPSVVTAFGVVAVEQVSVIER